MFSRNFLSGVVLAVNFFRLISATPVAAADQSAGNTYEYIVVGSGPGGGPLAANLARAGHSVLLLEAGDDGGSDLNYQVPAFQAKSTEDPLLAWDFYVKHYKDEARQMRDPKFTWRAPNGTLVHGTTAPKGSTPLGILYPRSAQLGGCGGHNALIALYPHNSDWDKIAAITGDSSWSSANMRQYLVQLEDVEYVLHSPNGHGFAGYLGIDEADPLIVVPDSKIIAMISSALSWANQTLINLLGDPNSPNPPRDTSTAVVQMPISTRNGARNSPREYILATTSATNLNGSKKYPLTVSLESLVTKVLFSGKAGNHTAVGVQYMKGQSLYAADPRNKGQKGTPMTAYASREVILAGGAYNTPQLLKLSGIGPAAELAKFGIPLIKDLPGVGTNLQDHYESSLINEVASPFKSIQNCTFGFSSPDPCLAQWESGPDSRGIYQSSGFAVGVFDHTPAANTSDTDIFLYGGPVTFKGYYPGYSYDATSNPQHWTWAIIKSSPASQEGTVMLRSADPTEVPDIQYNYFDTGAPGWQEDLDSLSNAILDARAMIKRYNPPSPSSQNRVVAELSPGANIQTKEQIQQWIQDSSWGHHASCSASIGADSNPMAVLDTNFRVRGVNSLRVVDASAFPMVPGFFIALSTYMLSQKATAVILQGLANSTLHL